MKDSYIVVLRDSAVAATDVGTYAERLAARHKGKVEHTYTKAVRGFSVSMSHERAQELAKDPGVSFVEQNQTVHTNDRISPPPSWGLDRIDQKESDRLVDDTFRWHSNVSGRGAYAYVIDTGIRITHNAFGGRAEYGYDFVDNDAVADDCKGHGTHVAGTIGGGDYGVAKQVRLVAVRVLGCDGRGTWANVIKGVDWVTQHAVQAAVANMSLGGGRSDAVDLAVTNSINAGIPYVVAAGNSNADACNESPARVPAAVTVAATDSFEIRPWYSNYGPCVDIFAPGSAIRSLWHASDTATAVLDGTSMAAPHVAGTIAQYLEPGPDWTPKQLADWTYANATPNVVQDPGTGSPNRMLHSAWWGPMGQATCSSTSSTFQCQATNKESGSAAWTTLVWRRDGVVVPAWNNQTSTSAQPCVAGTWYEIKVLITNVHSHTDEWRTGIRCKA